jgi:hypothetical protein
MVSPQHPNIRAEARAETVETLVSWVRNGEVRLPTFQRELRWEADDVIQLFDSIYRGYPIGTFLLSKGKAEAAKIKIGILNIDAPETQSAFWVIDGQQRLTALTVGLSRPLPIPTTSSDVWSVYFNPVERTFHSPLKDGNLPATWVPVPQLLNATMLSEWVHNWVYSNNPELRTLVFEAGSRIREYRIPLYIAPTSDESTLREIFNRVNNYGKSLKWKDVHDALYGHGGGHPSTLEDLASELQQLGMGRPEEEQLIPCLLAYKGLDVTRTITWHHRRDPDVLKNAAPEALPAIRSAISFLNKRAEILHLRLLPRFTPLPILTRFFTLYPDPQARTLNLLTRWVWRTLLSASFSDQRTLLRRGISVILSNDEEQSIQKLLSLIPNQRPPRFHLPSRFDARSAQSRLALIALTALQPINLQDGSPVDISGLIEEFHEFRKIIRSGGYYTQSPANRILLPGSGPARQEVLDWVKENPSLIARLSSHAISAKAILALTEKRNDEFMVMRHHEIELAVINLTDRLAAWGQSDRPSITYLLNRADFEK